MRSWSCPLYENSWTAWSFARGWMINQPRIYGLGLREDRGDIVVGGCYSLHDYEEQVDEAFYR